MRACIGAALLCLWPVCSAKLWLGTPPRGWEDYDSHTFAAYNESYARKAAQVMAQQVLPLGYDFYVIGGWSMGGQVTPTGIPDSNASHHWTFLDEYGRPVPDATRFPSAATGPGSCTCEPHNCTTKGQYECTDPACVCPEGSRSLRPLSTFLDQMGLRLGLWTWRGVHRAAAKMKLRVKGTNYTIDEIVDRTNGEPCFHGYCAGSCPWGPWLGVNASHPGAKPFYDSLYELMVDEWGVQFVKTDCQDWPSRRWADLTLQAEAAKRCVNTVALSYSPGVFGGEAPEAGAKLAAEQTGTMYRITTDFWGSWGAIAAPSEPYHSHGGSISRASVHANASLIGANGTFPDLDMMPLGQVKCDARHLPATTVPPVLCGCDNCDGGGEAYTIASLWAMARSPLLLGGALPLDAGTMQIISNPLFDLIHTSSRNHAVFAYSQANESDPGYRGWVKWSADLAGGSQWLRAGLLINVGNAEDSTSTALSDFGLSGSKYVVRDVWTGAEEEVDGSFGTALAAHNATLVLLRAA
eukprot:TRINITY_DN36990_c0_g1_i1.p1 TRINITY_DN36990_c0_g1~~TRINITY_DN36990_c0_g1_i1.p1  ORF type:complete len:523 (+),score=124.80 TRINITY_DN36990_c0_g1_i1:60-1628(+)